MNAEELKRTANHARYVPGQTRGHYESFFQRANHPTEPLAFWIRYTLFSPAGHPERAIGELWAVFFERGTAHVVVKEELPLAGCRFARDGLDVRVGDARLEPGVLRGEASSGGRRIGWDLRYRGGQEPLFDFPPRYYDRGFPRAKALVGAPLALYSGRLEIDGRSIDVADWPGSQNHNWGSKHTDRYAWGQVAGFDDAPEAFLELATARLKVGPLWTPWLTPIVLRHAGEEHALNALHTLTGRGSFDYFDWRFRARGRGILLEGRIRAEPDDFVCLRYRDPPGGTKLCLNSKIARCDLTVARPGAGPVALHSQHRAAFEILTDDTRHGLVPRV